MKVGCVNISEEIDQYSVPEDSIAIWWLVSQGTFSRIWQAQFYTLTLTLNSNERTVIIPITNNVLYLGIGLC